MSTPTSTRKQRLRIVKSNKPSDADRNRRRRLINSLSARPLPGSSELLSSPLSQEVSVRGAKDIITHDLTRLAPMHLLGGTIDAESRRRSR